MNDMWALTFDRSREDWSSSRGLVKERVPRPDFDAARQRDSVLIRVRYAGFCGSDRGIWHRKSFGDMILGSLDEEGRDKRIVGHELLGEIVERGADVSRYEVGDAVSTESHIVCGECLQCRRGEYHVCAQDKIIGISRDGCFAEYIVLPEKALWKTDLTRIRPEVAAIQEPFGNAVHVCQVTDLRGATVAILGTGTIGLFAVLIARGLGASKIIGVDPDPHHLQLAKSLGCDIVFSPEPPPTDQPWRADAHLRAAVLAETDGAGVDVAFEMAGHPSSLNNAIQVTRRGGHVVLFGVRNGDSVIQDAHRVVMNGLSLHGVVGRRLFSTWETTQTLLESTENGIQQAVWDVILGQGASVVDLAHWTPDGFESVMSRFTKPVIRFS